MARKAPKPKKKAIAVKIGEGLPSLHDMREEIDAMMSVLLGRESTPVDSGILTLHEVAFAYYARATEMTMSIHRGEANGTVLKGSGVYKFRTGELRDFMELCKRAQELGSRRVTYAKLEWEQA